MLCYRARLRGRCGAIMRRRCSLLFGEMLDGGGAAGNGGMREDRSVAVAGAGGME